MKKHSIYIIICLLFYGCNTFEKPKKPDNLLSESKMSEVLYDMFIMNSAKGVNKKLIEKNGIFPEAYILKKHKIDSVQFAESNNYYVYDIKTYESIISDVKAKITKEKTKYEAQLKIEKAEKKKHQDSIRKIKKKRRDSINKLKQTPINNKKILKQIAKKKN